MIENTTDIEDLTVHNPPSDVNKNKKIKIKMKTNVKVNLKPVKLVTSEIISASRRTDIPAQYMPQVIDAIKKGYISVTSPYGQTSMISLSPIDVKCFVWWSKDYNNWLDCYQRETSLFTQFKHMFNFTLTGDNQLELGIKSSFDQRLDQLRRLSALFGPESIKLRFDPITYWIDAKTGQLCNNTTQFATVMETAHNVGITSTIFAFCLPYPKVVNRMQKYGKILQQLSIIEQKRIMDPLLEIAKNYNIQMQTCCGSQLIGYNGIVASKCVDGEIIEKICGSTIKTKRKDAGQRKECNCATSRDIGSYKDMKCQHKCLYCYANPAM